MKHIYIFFFALAVSVSAMAQANFKPGYILTSDSSRIDGLVDYRGTNAKAALQVSFKTSETAEAIIYQPLQLIGYGLADGKLYNSITVPTTDNTGYTYFMEVLAKGAATLYFMKDEQLKERFFITTNDSRIHELKEEKRRVEAGNGKIYNATLKHYVGTLTSLLDGCAEIKSLITKARLEQSDMIRVVNKYNVCIAPDKVIVAKNADKTKASIEKMLVVGSTFTNVVIKSDSYDARYVTQGDVRPSLDFTGGIALNITASKISQNLSLYTGLMYQHYRMEGDYRKEYEGGGYDAFDFYLEATHLKMPILLRYTWPKGKIKPYVNAGAQGAVLLNADSKVIEMHKNKYGDYIQHEREMMPSYRKVELGFIGGIGVKTVMFGNTTITLEARQERNNGLSSGIGFIQTNNISSVLLGVSF